MQIDQVRGRQSKELLRGLILLCIGIGFFIPLAASHLPLYYWIWIVGTIFLFPLVYLVRQKVLDVNLLWIVMILGSSLSFRHRDPTLLGTSQAVDAQVMAELGILAMCSLFVLFKAAPQLNRVLKAISAPPLGWMFAYALMALVSTIYSLTMALTLVRSLQLLVALALLGVAISIENVSARRMLDVTVFTLLIIQAAVWTLYFAVPDLAITAQTPNLRRLGGLLIHPNGLGAVAAVLSVVALCRVLVAKKWSRWPLYLGVFLTSVITLVATQSRASLVAGLLGSLGVLMLLKRKFLLLLIVIVILLVILFLPWVAGLGIERFERGQDITRLTGRVFVWRYVFDQVVKSVRAFLLGYGFGSSRLSLLAQLPGSWTHTHNAFMEAFMGLGLFGVVFLVMSFTSTGFFLLKETLGNKGEDFAFHVELFGVVIVLFVVSMASAAVVGEGISSFVYLSVLACCVRIGWERGGLHV